MGKLNLRTHLFQLWLLVRIRFITLVTGVLLDRCLTKKAFKLKTLSSAVNLTPSLICSSLSVLEASLLVALKMKLDFGLL